MKSTSFPPSLQKLINEFSRLPSIGLRSAERLALHIVKEDTAGAEEFAAAIRAVKEKIRSCEQCGHLTEHKLCDLCQDSSRDRTKICVVEQATDVLSIERSGSYGGLYHVLGGKLSPLNKVGPEQLRIRELIARLEGAAEVILALPADVEGDVTATYLANELKNRKVKVTRIAMGIPAGAGLDFADGITLSHALHGRREMDRVKE
jgi:recombination protein RecR